MRALARESVFKIIYKSLFLNGDLSFEEILEEDNITPEKDKDFDVDFEYIKELLNLYEQNSKEIENKINSKIKGYTPERVYRIDRAILNLAITEMFYYKQTPIKVVINEAIELAKKYSTEKSYSFVNGVLKSLLEENDGI